MKTSPEDITVLLVGGGLGRMTGAVHALESRCVSASPHRRHALTRPPARHYCTLPMPVHLPARAINRRRRH